MFRLPSFLLHPWVNEKMMMVMMMVMLLLKMIGQLMNGMYRLICVCVCVHELSAYLYINTFLFASSYPWYLSFCCLIIHHRNMYTHWLLSYTVQYRISSRINNTPIFFFQLNHDRLTSTWKPLTCYVLVIRRGHFCCHEEFSPLENVSYSVS